jgi:hypothetical protein
MKKFKSLLSISILLISSISLAGCGLGSKTVPTIIFGTCWLDTISGGNRDSAGDFLVSSSTPDLILRGWIANDVADESPKTVTAIIADEKGKILVSDSSPSTGRPDVAQAYNKPGMANSGFEILIENVKIRGKYAVSLQGEYESGNLLCSKTFNLVVG